MYVVRRWWSVVAAGVVIGAVVGWLSALGATQAATTFQATQVMLAAPSVTYTKLNQAALLANAGPVPSRVAARLGINRRLVESMVSAELRANEGALSIIGRSTERGQ